MNIKSLLVATALITSPLLMMPANARETVIPVRFAANSYCGSYSGDLWDGKKFSLVLGANQDLIINSLGDDQVNVAYVEGPRGRLYTYPVDDVGSIGADTDYRGTHYIKSYSTAHYSNVEFCAYDR